MKILVTIKNCPRCHAEEERLQALGEPFLKVDATGASSLQAILTAVLAEWSLHDMDNEVLEFPLLFADAQEQLTKMLSWTEILNEIYALNNNLEPSMEEEIILKTLIWVMGGRYTRSGAVSDCEGGVCRLGGGK